MANILRILKQLLCIKHEWQYGWVYLWTSNRVCKKCGKVEVANHPPKPE